jgi:glycerol-3-phosphate dehydrogenase
LKAAFFFFITIKASRGLKTALVEKYDFSSGTSSRSTKLIHGGVRYLQKAIMQLDIEQVVNDAK